MKPRRSVWGTQSSWADLQTTLSSTPETLINSETFRRTQKSFAERSSEVCDDRFYTWSGTGGWKLSGDELVMRIKMKVLSRKNRSDQTERKNMSGFRRGERLTSREPAVDAQHISHHRDGILWLFLRIIAGKSPTVVIPTQKTQGHKSSEFWRKDWIGARDGFTASKRISKIKSDVGVSRKWIKQERHKRRRCEMKRRVNSNVWRMFEFHY